MNACLRRVSGYLPETVLTNAGLSGIFPDIRMEDLTRLTGVRQRHIARPDETAADMAVAAALNLFKEHSIDPSDIDFVLLNTQWPDYITPSSSCIIQDRLNIPQSAGTLDISQGCTGYIYGLAMAKGLVESGSAKNVLLLTAETITKSVHPADHSNRAIFGDGATASLISASEDNEGCIGSFVFGTDGKKYEDIIIRAGGARNPIYSKSADPEDWAGKIPREELFFMNGPAVFTFSVNVTPGLIRDILDKNKLRMEEIDCFIFHQANQIILETIIRKNKIPQEKAVIHLENVGNTVSSTIPMALAEAMKHGKISKGSKVLLAAFGVGLSWGGTIIKF
jgi:3-oxoacyl-[acyl-carrier-protein] synthase-3